MSYDIETLQRKKLLTRDEAAAYIGVGAVTMHNIMHGADFPALIRIGHNQGCGFVNREIFDKWINEQTGKKKE